MKTAFVAFFFLSCICLMIFVVHSKKVREFDLLNDLISAKRAKDGVIDTSAWENHESYMNTVYAPVFDKGTQDGSMEDDKIDALPGQPEGVDFDHYAGYVTVDPNHGRALFYYLAESPEDSSTKPLVLWLNGGPGCSSLGAGAMMELGPFRVNSDGKTLYLNEFAWNKVANIIFLESPAGVGFSYSNTTSDYDLSGDKRTAQDSYTFLIKWLEKFPQYKNRDFFITGESYAGHYVPQLAQTILYKNKITNQTIINLKGIAIGNALIDQETYAVGSIDFDWTHALTSDEIYQGISLNCNFSSATSISRVCEAYLSLWGPSVGDIYPYDIYAPLCNSNLRTTRVSTEIFLYDKNLKKGSQLTSYRTNDSKGNLINLSYDSVTAIAIERDIQLPSYNSVNRYKCNRVVEVFDPCSEDYIHSYLNLPQVQTALHANVTGLPYTWESCSGFYWKDSPRTILPTIQELMDSGILVWIYSGDIDDVIPVTSTRYSIKRLKTSVEAPWYPWYTEGEVGGYAVGYQSLTFVTVRGAGHFVPSYQPARALTLFTSFLQGTLPPPRN